MNERENMAAKLNIKIDWGKKKKEILCSSGSVVKQRTWKSELESYRTSTAAKTKSDNR